MCQDREEESESESPADREARAAVDEVLRPRLTPATRDLIVGIDGIHVAGALHAVSRLISNELHSRMTPHAWLRENGSVDVGDVRIIAIVTYTEIARATGLWNLQKTGAHRVVTDLYRFAVLAAAERPTLFEHLRRIPCAACGNDVPLALVAPADRVTDARKRWNLIGGT